MKIFIKYIFSIIIISYLVGQNKVPMSIVDLINVPSIGSPQLSPDGNYLQLIAMKINEFLTFGV